MATIKEYLDLIIGVLSLIAGFIFFLVSVIKRAKALKNAKTTEEWQSVINEIKSDTYGLITVAENLFSDIPKSGASKLLYVLNHVKELCTEKGFNYDQEYWTDFINTIVLQSNEVKDEKAYESVKADIIQKIKDQVPYFITEADKLFSSIPDNEQYKIEYVLKLIAVACDKYNVNVFAEYDWRAYVINQYHSEVA